MVRFLFIFVLVLVVLFVGELTPFAQQWLVIPWTSLLTKVCAFLLQLFDSNVVSYGKVLQNAKSGIGVSVEPGCNGVEACVILIAAIVAYPTRWKSKLVGIACGILAIQSVNLLRIITLFYLAGWRTDVFEFAHLYLWQVLIMLDVLVVWLVWMRWISRQDVRRLNHSNLQASA